MFVGMPPLIITASHIAQEEENTISSVSVITREDIEFSGAKSVTDILKNVAGVQITQSGGKGQLQSLSMRGTRSNQTLILIDGQRTGSATTGATAFNFISVDHIQRIEIVRGNHSSVHGSDAIGGVINIITHSTEENYSNSIGLTLGQEHTEAHSFKHSGSFTPDNQYGISLSHFTTQGYDVTSEESFNNEPDNDNYRNSSAAFHFNHDFNTSLATTLSGLYTEGNAAFDNTFGNDETDFENSNISLNTVYSYKKLQSNILVNESQDKSRTFGKGVKLSEGDIFSTLRRSISWDNIIASEPNQSGINSLELAFGINWYEDDVSESSVNYDVTDRTNSAAYIEFQYDKSQFHSNLGYRAEDNEQFGSFDSYNIGLQYNFCQCFKLAGTLSTGFRSPTFNELYYPGFSNPDLSPEEFKSYEFNLKGNVKNIDESFEWSINIYQTSIENSIVFFFDPLALTFTPHNLGKVQTRGQEIIISFNWLDTRHVFSSEWISSTNKDKKSLDYGNDLPLIPEKSLKWTLNKQWQAVSLNVSLNYTGQRYSDAKNSEQLHSFSTVDINTIYLLNNNINLGFRVENLFNKEYTSTGGFGDYYVGQPRIAFFDLTYAF